MELSNKIASDLTTYCKYSRYISERKRRETWLETVERCANMHKKRYPKLREIISNAFEYVADKKILPSMRSLQFGGKAIEVNESRIYNCGYMAANYPKFFSELMFLLLGGTGVGYSVQHRHIRQLPTIKHPGKERRFSIQDSIIGWADAIKALFSAYFDGTYLPRFDFDDVRPAGAVLKTAGGKAPGPAPLRTCLAKIQGILEAKKRGSKLESWEVSDIACIIADAVLSGGIRRSAMIALFDMDDEKMLSYKTGAWWDLHPERSRVNVSAVGLRNVVTSERWNDFWNFVKNSGSGEPGIYWSNDFDAGTNPSLRAGTRVVTDRGVYPIEQLENTSFLVPNLDGNWSRAKCWKSGINVPLIKISLDTGESYYSSSKHEWPIFINGRFVKARATELKKNDCLPVNKFVRSSLHNAPGAGTRLDGFLAGWLYGDGCITVRTDSHKRVASFVVSQDDGEDVRDKLLSHIKTIDGVDRKFYSRGKVWEWQVGSDAFIGWLDKYGVGKKEQGFPKELWTMWSEEMIRGFVDGLVSSDGHVPEDSHGISLVSSRHNLAKDFQDLLGFYGIKSSMTHKTQNGASFPGGFYNKEYHSYVVRTTVIGREKFKSVFALSVKRKQNQLNKKLKHWMKKPETVRIVSVEPTNMTEDVWDICVDDETHCFQLPQTTTGNCCEISLRHKQFCNLSTINFSDIESQAELNERANKAAVLGTLQAGYTDFHYLTDEWQENCEAEALLGVSITGIADGGHYKGFDWRSAAKVVCDTNAMISKIMGINQAARLTCTKPEGTASLVLGSSSGIHARHSHYYIRRIRLGKDEPIAQYLSDKHPELVVQDKMTPNQIIVELPQKSPDRSIYRDESPIELLERVKYFNENWIVPGHRSGNNRHNISCTVSVKEKEWDKVGNWMYENRSCYNGLSVLPYDGGTYVQAPFEECSKDEYDKRMEALVEVNLAKIKEETDETKAKEEAACAGGKCEI